MWWYLFTRSLASGVCSSIPYIYNSLSDWSLGLFIVCTESRCVPNYFRCRYDPKDSMYIELVAIPDKLCFNWPTSSLQLEIFILLLTLEPSVRARVFICLYRWCDGFIYKYMGMILYARVARIPTPSSVLYYTLKQCNLILRSNLVMPI